MPFFFDDRRHARNLSKLVVDGFINLGRKLDNFEAKIMSTLADIQASADQLRDLSATLITSVQTEAASIADLQARLAAVSSPDPTVQTQIDAIAAELSTTVGNLQAATTSATVATPPATTPVDGA